VEKEEKLERVAGKCPPRAEIDGSGRIFGPWQRDMAGRLGFERQRRYGAPPATALGTAASWRHEEARGRDDLLRRCFHAPNRVINTGGGAQFRRTTRLGARQGEAAGAREGRYDASYRAESAGPPWCGSQGRPAAACRVLPGHRRARAQMGSVWAGGWASGGRREVGLGLQARPGRVGFLFFEFVLSAKIIPKKSRNYF
jgi:hypothetical protein